MGEIDKNGSIHFDDFLRIVKGKILERNPSDEIDNCFALMNDGNSSGISFKALKKVAKELGENMTDEEIMEMIEEGDKDGDTLISKEEFTRLMLKTNLF